MKQNILSSGSRRIARSIGAAICGAMLCSIALALAGCGGGKASSGAAAAKPANALPVAAQPVKQGDVTARFSLTGVVAPRQQAMLSSVVSGSVVAVNVTLGQHVHAGDVLVQIDDSTIRAQLAQAEGALALAQARLAQVQANDTGNSATANANLTSAKVGWETAEQNFTRNQELFKQGYVSKVTLDQAQSQAAAAQAQYQAAQVAAQNANLQGAQSAGQADIRSSQAAVAQAAGAAQIAQSQLAQTTITAPFEGIITQRSVDRGSPAAPGVTLVQVSQLDPAWVNVGIPDEDLKFVHDGTPVDITIDAIPGRSWKGKVQIVNSAASAGTLSYLTHIVIPNKDLVLKGGMVANISFAQATHRNVMLVPRVAVFQTDAGGAVYIVKNDKAKSIPVKTGLQTDTSVEVSGLSPGDLVITQRPDSLQDGSAVTVVGAPEGQATSSSQTSR
jgi:HlyD family secretion protein